MKKILLSISLAIVSVIQTNAQEITIDSLTYILKETNYTATLKYCQKKGDIVIPDAIDSNGTQYVVDEVESYTFRGNQDITSIVYPKAVKKVWGLENCYNLRSVTLPDSLKEIYAWAFMFCFNLSTIVIPEGCETIGNEAFKNSGLESIVLPSTLKKLGNSVFQQCSLQSVEIPASVEEFGRGLFFNCNGLTTAKILCSVLGKGAFSYCQNLETVELSPDLKVIESGAFNNSGISTIQIPGSVEIINDKAFESCKNLVSLELPASLDSIGEKAFNSCIGLEIITSYAENPPKAAFDNIFTYYDTNWRIYENAVLEVPAGSVEAYKNAPVWKNFSKIYAIGTTTDIEFPSVQTGQDETAASYTLNGVRTNGQTKGLILRREGNGKMKKVLVK